MTPQEFKSRFIELLPALPPDLDLELDRFVIYPADRVASLRIPEGHKAFLIESGLPADAAPFLNFQADGERSLKEVEGIPETAIIGFNNYGDDICLDMSDDGAVVYHNHDNRMKRVLMNSSLPLFAECLCAFSQLKRTRDFDGFHQHVLSIDPIALAPGTFWATESANERED